MGNVMCMGEASREVRMHGGACSEEVNVRLTKIRKFFFFFFFVCSFLGTKVSRLMETKYLENFV
jgi:hypothetical protein